MRVDRKLKSAEEKAALPAKLLRPLVPAKRARKKAMCMTMTGRPLFRDEASFRALHAQRLPSYQLADYHVDSSGEPTQVVAEILRRGIVASGGNAAHLVVEKPLP